MATLMSCVLKCVAIFLPKLQVCNFLSQIHPNPSKSIQIPCRFAPRPTAKLPGLAVLNGDLREESNAFSPRSLNGDNGGNPLSVARIAKDCKGLQRIAKDCKGLQRIAKDCKDQDGSRWIKMGKVSPCR